MRQRLALGAMVLLAAVAVGCASGDASCKLSQKVDDHGIYTCIEGPNLDSEEYDEFENDCEQMAGRTNYTSSTFQEGLCTREGLVGGCDLGGGKRLWYYPNEQGYPTTADLESACAFHDLEVAPPP